MHKVLSQSIAAELSDIRAASTANGGTALTTSIGITSIPIGSDWIDITPRNFVTAVVARILLCPRLTVVVTTDALGSIGVHGTDEPTTITDFATQVISDEMQDGDTEDFAMDAFSTAANNNYIYIGADKPFRGALVTVGSDPNNTASILTVKYLRDSAWVDISDTDGTASGGATFTQDGAVTWTVPTAWTKQSLVKVGDTTVREPWSIADLYWTRWEVSATTEVTWNIAAIRGLNRSTNYLELIEGKALEFALDTSKISGVEAITDDGTANLIVNVGVLDTSSTGKKETFR